jgi:hypothetical protein
MGPIYSPETSVRKYHYTLRNIPKEHRTHNLFLFAWEEFVAERVPGFLRWRKFMVATNFKKIAM